MWSSDQSEAFVLPIIPPPGFSPPSSPMNRSDSSLQSMFEHLSTDSASTSGNQIIRSRNLSELTSSSGTSFLRSEAQSPDELKSYDIPLIHQNFLAECLSRNRRAAFELSQKVSHLYQQIEKSFAEIHDCLNARRVQLTERLALVFSTKLSFLNTQLDEIQLVGNELKTNRMPIEVFNGKIPLLAQPADNDQISISMDDIIQIQKLIGRMGQINTNACAGLSYICRDGVFQHSTSDPIYFQTQKPFQLEIQTKNYLGILMTNGGDLVQATVIQTATNSSYPAAVLDCRNGRYLVSTMFMSPGRFAINITVNGKLIKGVPFYIIAHCPDSINSTLRRNRKFVIQYKPNAPSNETLRYSKSSDGSTISEYSMFCRPWGVCADFEDNIYVADRSNNHIKVMRNGSSMVLAIGSYGKDKGQFDRPSGICFDNTLSRLVVCDKDNHRLQVFEINPIDLKNKCLETTGSNWLEEIEMKPLLTFGRRGSAIGEFHYPWDCAINKQSDIIVTDTRNHRIQMFNKSGLFIRKFSCDCNSLCNKRFDSPRGICVTSNDEIVVTDFNNHRIVVFNAELKNEYFLCNEGEEPGKLKRPQGIAVDKDNNLLVADSRNYRIQRLTIKGKFIEQFGRLGENGDDDMDRPTGICVLKDGSVLVMDFGNNRLLAF